MASSYRHPWFDGRLFSRRMWELVQAVWSLHHWRVRKLSREPPLGAQIEELAQKLKFRLQLASLRVRVGVVPPGPQCLGGVMLAINLSVVRTIEIV